jgi:hypothetical protein
MTTPNNAKYVIRLSSGLITQKAPYFLPNVEQEINVSLLGDTRLGGETLTFTKPTSHAIKAFLERSYVDEEEDIVFVYRFVGLN